MSRTSDTGTPHRGPYSEIDYSGLSGVLRALAGLSRFAWEAGPFVLTGLVASTLLGGTGPALELWAMALLVDAVSAAAGNLGAGGGVGAALGWVGPWVALLVGVRLAQSALTLLRQRLHVQMQEDMTAVILSKVLAKSARLSLIHYESPAFHDKLRRIEDEMGLGFVNYFYFILELVRLSIVMAGLIVVTVQAHWLIPVIILGSTLPVLKLQSRHDVDRYALVHAHTPERRLMQYLAGVLTGRGEAKEVRLFQLGPYLIERWRSIYDRQRGELMAQRRKQRLIRAAIDAVPVLAFAAALALLVVRGASGAVTTGAAVAVLYAVLRMQDQGIWLVDFLGEVHRYSVTLTADLLNFLAMPEHPWEVENGREAADVKTDRGASTEVEAKRWSRPFPDGRHRIDVVDLTFRYPNGSEPALSGVTFEIEPGEKVALVGENGAGKTTLVKLLLGLYEPEKGRILYDGVHLRMFKPESFRAQVSAVFQDYAAYHLTVRENIGFGLVSRLNDADAVRKAAALGGAADFVAAWPEGYDTVLGPTFGGRDLSGGQWQKVATSRAFMREPYLLVLDEPTAALDPKAEVEVYRRFKEMAGGRTALLISHRIGFARLADRILVLKAGRLAESGTHAELVAAGGEYARLYRAQARWYQS